MEISGVMVSTCSLMETDKAEPFLARTLLAGTDLYFRPSSHLAKLWTYDLSHLHI